MAELLVGEQVATELLEVVDCPYKNHKRNDGIRQIKRLGGRVLVQLLF